MENFKSFVESLKQRISIVDVIGRYVPLKPKGKSFWGCCPFHAEKTPSFSVTEEMGIFKCFGCNEGGDVITFLMKHQSLQYMDALRELSMIAGVKMPDFKPRDAEEEKREADYFEIMTAAADMFHAALPGSPAAEYLSRRDLSAATIAKYKLGYAPTGNILTKRFGQSAIPAGLVRNGQDGSRYDFFRNRLMFPIFSPRGQVIAFSGRSLDGSEPKYINIAETEFFQKRRTLFGLNLAIESIRRQKRAIVVEGQIDTIQMQTNGFGETVAPLGTALTVEHIQILLKYTKEIIFCFDGDTAGRKAAARAAGLIMPLLVADMTIKFSFVPAGSDPDDIIRKGGDMSLILNDAKLLPDFIWDIANTEFPVMTESGRTRADKWMRAEFEKIPDVLLKNEILATLKNRTFKEWNKFRRTIVPEMRAPDPLDRRARIIQSIAALFPDLYDANFELLGQVVADDENEVMSIKRDWAEKFIQEAHLQRQINDLVASGAPHDEIQVLRDRIFEIWN